MHTKFKKFLYQMGAISLFMLLLWTCYTEPKEIIPAPEPSSQQQAAIQADKQVFANYMVCCPVAGGESSVEDYKNEIREAQQRGVDGFALNCGGWHKTEPHYKKRTLLIYEAARQLGTNFQLFISVDDAAFREIDDIITSFQEHPNQFRYKGKQVVSTFAGEGPHNDGGKQLIKKVHARGAILVPYFFPRPDITELPQESHARQLLRTFPNLDGYFYFGAAGTGPQIAASIETLGRAFVGAGKIFMAGITPYYRGNELNFRVFETRGFEAMAQEWESAIRCGATWVQLVTWNDWVESSYLAPFGPPEETRLWGGHFGPKMLSHVAYLDASRYHIDWFKTGVPPAITQDKLFYFYRLHPKSKPITIWAQQNQGEKGWPGGTAALSDEIFVTLFLTRPAQLVITSGKRRRKFDVAAGMSHLSMPFNTGKQHFALYRKKKLVISKFGEHKISATDMQSRFNYFAGSAMAPL